MTKVFSRWVRKAGLTSDMLLRAAMDVIGGQYDADLGGGVYKQRLARLGQGKSGGFRAILLFRVGSHVFLVHGFAKNEKANVSERELKALRRLADLYASYSADEIVRAEHAGELIKVEKEDGGEEAGEE